MKAEEEAKEMSEVIVNHFAEGKGGETVSYIPE